MFHGSLRTTLTAVIALAFATGFPVLAQDAHKHEAQPPSNQRQDSMMQMMRMMHGAMPYMRMMGAAGPGMMMGGAIQHVDGHIAFLKTELKITGAQTAAWEEFATALRGNAERINSMQTMVSSAVRTLDTRLEAQEKFLGVRIESVKRTRVALSKLVAALSDDQRKKLEAMLSGMGH